MFNEGQQFGFYTLIRQLGRGGFGEVWLAERRTRFLTTQVAVKLPLDEQVDHAAIEQEAQLWARASGHANVLPIIEANEYDGQILIVSEYAVDGSLEGLLQESGGALPMKQAVDLTTGILKGLEFLHARQIIHRDIKPANILLQGDTPRLADFGISRVLKTTSLATQAVGTPHYMAPEAFGRKRNAQTDVWSVGVLLYQMLTGKLPFFGDNITDLFGAIMLTEPPPLPDGIPGELQKIVGKALLKDVAERYQIAREMRDELEDFRQRVSSPVVTLPLPAVAPPPPVVTPTPAIIAPPPEPPVVTKGNDRTTVPLPVVPPPPDHKTVAPPEVIKQPDEIKMPKIVANKRSVLPSALPSVKANRNRLYGTISIIAPLLAAMVGIYWLLYSTPGDPTASNAFLAALSSPDGTQGPLLIPFRKGDKFGFSDVNKTLVIEAKYDEAYPFKEGLAGVKQDGKWGYVDKTGREVIALKYNSAYSFNGELAIVSLNGKWGYVDKTGQEVIALKYDLAGSFSEGLARVRRNGKWGCIDKTGREVIALKYDLADEFSEGLVWVRRNGKWGCVDKTGQEVIALKYGLADEFSEGLARVRRDGKEGYVDKTGQEIIALKYDLAGSFSEGLARVRRDGKEGYVDKTGREVIALKYDLADEFSEGLARVKQNGKWGYVDKTGQEVMAFKYDSAYSFSGGLALVILNNKWGYVDKTGQEVIALKYDSAYPFLKGLAWVERDSKGFYIDKNGTEYYEP
jgi:serine/threonine protein kinase